MLWVWDEAITTINKLSILFWSFSKIRSHSFIHFHRKMKARKCVTIENLLFSLLTQPIFPLCSWFRTITKENETDDKGYFGSKKLQHTTTAKSRNVTENSNVWKVFWKDLLKFSDKFSFSIAIFVLHWIESWGGPDDLEPRIWIFYWRDCENSKEFNDKVFWGFLMNYVRFYLIRMKENE